MAWLGVAGPSCDTAAASALGKAEAAARCACGVARQLPPDHQATAYMALARTLTAHARMLTGDAHLRRVGDARRALHDARLAVGAAERNGGRENVSLLCELLDGEAEFEAACGNTRRAADLHLELLRLRKAEAGGAPDLSVVAATCNAATALVAAGGDAAEPATLYAEAADACEALGLRGVACECHARLA
eukprot:gene18355-21389_t